MLAGWGACVLVGWLAAIARYLFGYARDYFEVGQQFGGGICVFIVCSAFELNCSNL